MKFILANRRPRACYEAKLDPHTSISWRRKQAFASSFVSSVPLLCLQAFASSSYCGDGISETETFFQVFRRHACSTTKNLNGGPSQEPPHRVAQPHSLPSPRGEESIYHCRHADRWSTCPGAPTPPFSSHVLPPSHSTSGKCCEILLHPSLCSI